LNIEQGTSINECRSINAHFSSPAPHVQRLEAKASVPHKLRLAYIKLRLA